MADLETLRVTVDATVSPFKKKMQEVKETANQSMQKVEQALDGIKVSAPDTDMSSGLNKVKQEIDGVKQKLNSINAESLDKVGEAADKAADSLNNAKSSGKVSQAITAAKIAAAQASPKLAALGKALSGAAALGKKGFGLMATAANKARQAISTVSGVAQSLVHKFTSMASSVKNFASSILHIGKSSDQTAGKVNILKGAISKLIGLFAIRGIFNFAKDSIELGSNLTEVQNVVDNVFPHMKNKLGEWATAAASTYGLSETMAKKYSGTFGAMAKSFGFSESAAYDMSTTLAGLTGDVASFYNLTQDEAYTKMKSVFTGETESLKELGIVMTKSALDSFALANGFGKTTAKMTEAEKVSLRYAFVQKQLSTAAGDFSRTSDGWANQVRILSLQFESLKATIGQGLINALTPVIKVVNTLIGRIATVANSFKALTEFLFGNAGSANGAEQTASGLNDAASAANNLADATKNAGNEAADAAKKALGLMGFDKINKLADDSSSSSGNSDTGSSAGASVDYGSIDTAEESTSALGKAMAKLFDPFKEAWEEKGERVITAWKTAVENIKTLFSDIGKTIAEVWSDGTGARYLKNILELVANIGDIIGAFAKSIDDAWNDDGTGEKYIQSIYDKWNSVLELINAIAKAFTTVWGNGTGSSIIKDYLGIVTDINETISHIAENFKKAWEEGGKGEEIIQDLLNIVSKVTGKVKEFTGSMESWSKGLDFGPLLDSVDTFLKSIEQGDWKKAGSVVGEGIGSINTVISNFTTSDGFKTACSDFGKDVADALSGIISKINLKDAGTAISGALEGAFDAVNSFLKEFDWKELGKQIGEFLGAINWVTLLADAAKLMWNGFFSLTSGITGIIEGFVDGAVDNIENDLKNNKTLKSIGETVTKAIGDAKVTIKAVKDTAWDKVKEAWDGIKTGAYEAKKTITAAAANTWDKIKAKWDKIVDVTKTKTMALKKSKTWQKIKDSWDAIKSKTATISLKIEAMKDGIKDWLNNNVVIPLENKLKTVPILGSYIKTGTLPRFAQGAYVGANKPMLAMIGDNKQYGEYVAPENKMEAMADRAAENAGAKVDYDLLSRIIRAAVYAALMAADEGGRKDVNVVLEGDADKLFKVIVKKIKEYQRIHGSLPFSV